MALPWRCRGAAVALQWGCSGARLNLGCKLPISRGRGRGGRYANANIDKDALMTYGGRVATPAAGEEVLFEDVAELLGPPRLDAKLRLQRGDDPVLGPRLFPLQQSNNLSIIFRLHGFIGHDSRPWRRLTYGSRTPVNPKPETPYSWSSRHRLTYKLAHFHLLHF